MRIASCFQDIATINGGIQKKKQGRTGEMLTDDLFLTNQAEYSDKSRFEELCRMRFPKAVYHLMDLSGMSENVWQRTDFPVEKLFEENIDEKITEWNQTGTEPKMSDSSVQKRLNSVLGQYSIIVPPELETKIKENPDLADGMMRKIDELFRKNGHPVTGRINGGVVAFDRNGDIAHYNLISGGGRISGPTKSQTEMIEREQKEKQKRKENYQKIQKENFVHRKLQEERLQHSSNEEQNILKNNKSDAKIAVFPTNMERVSLDTEFKDIFKSKYPGAYFNVMDTSKIDHGLWGRNDYPWDSFFVEPADASVLDWMPKGAEPSMQNREVVTKINQMAGKLAVVISPELEEKMRKDEKLVEQVLESVDEFIGKYFRPEANQGFLITFNGNGEIGEACIVVEGRITVSSSDFVEARRAREKKRREYEEMAEEIVMERKLFEKMSEKKQSEILYKSIVEYQTTFIYSENKANKPVY